MTPPETLETLVTPPKTLETLVVEEVVDASPDPIVVVDESNVVDESPVTQEDAEGNHVVENSTYPVDAEAFPPSNAPDIADWKKVSPME